MPASIAPRGLIVADRRDEAVARHYLDTDRMQEGPARSGRGASQSATREPPSAWRLLHLGYPICLTLNV